MFKTDMKLTNFENCFYLQNAATFSLRRKKMIQTWSGVGVPVECQKVTFVAKSSSFGSINWIVRRWESGCVIWIEKQKQNLNSTYALMGFKKWKVGSLKSKSGSL